MGNEYYIGQGNVFIAPRNTDGTAGKLSDLLESPMFEISPQVDYVDNFESASGLRRQDLHVPIKTMVKGSVQLKIPNSANLALMLNGVSTTVAASTILSGAAVPFVPASGIVAGDTVILPGDARNVTGGAIRDSAVTPAVLVSGTDYDADWRNGQVKFKGASIAGFVQPFKFSGTIGAYEQVSLLTNPGSEYYMRANLLNTAVRPFKKRQIELYRVVFEVVHKFDGKGDAVAMYEIGFVPLNDDTKPEDPILGRYGRVIILD